MAASAFVVQTQQASDATHCYTSRKWDAEHIGNAELEGRIGQVLGAPLTGWQTVQQGLELRKSGSGDVGKHEDGAYPAKYGISVLSSGKQTHQMALTVRNGDR